MSPGSVLACRPLPTSKSYQDAVAKIVRRLKLQHGLSDQELADRIGVSRGTIRNADGCKGDLGAVALLRIEHTFGSGEIDLAFELAGSTACPVDLGNEGQDDLLPLLSALMMMIATARSPQSPGGRAETHTEQLAMETLLLDTRRGLNRRLAHLRQIRGC
jgi:transcriptional regulator with XRE-family HTH domain